MTGRNPLSLTQQQLFWLRISVPVAKHHVLHDFFLNLSLPPWFTNTKPNDLWVWKPTPPPPATPPPTPPYLGTLAHPRQSLLDYFMLPNNVSSYLCEIYCFSIGLDWQHKRWELRRSRNISGRPPPINSLHVTSKYRSQDYELWEREFSL